MRDQNQVSHGARQHNAGPDIGWFVKVESRNIPYHLCDRSFDEAASVTMPEASAAGRGETKSHDLPDVAT
jgi:hypothetical protein